MSVDPTVRRRAREQAVADKQMLRELVQIRKSKERTEGLTQAEVARRMSTDPAVISRLESGAVDPRRMTLRMYAVAIGARITYGVTDLDLPQLSLPTSSLKKWSYNPRVTAGVSGSL